MNQIVTIVVPVFGLIGIGYLPRVDRGCSTRRPARRSPTSSSPSPSRCSSSAWSRPPIFPAARRGCCGSPTTSASRSPGSPGTFLVRRVFGRDARAGLVGGISAAYRQRAPHRHSAHHHRLRQRGRGGDLASDRRPPADPDDGERRPDRAGAGHRRPVARCRCARRSCATIGRNLLKNPIILGLFAGIVWRLTGLPIGGPAGDVVDRLADVAATLALFSVGMNLRQYGISRQRAAGVAWSASIKLLLMPAIVFLVVAYLIPLPPVWAKAIVIAAACPTGVNAYLVATPLQDRRRRSPRTRSR